MQAGGLKLQGCTFIQYKETITFHLHHTINLFRCIKTEIKSCFGEILDETGNEVLEKQIKNMILQALNDVC